MTLDKLALTLLLLLPAISCRAHESKGSTSREIIHTDGAPAAIGPYSQAIRIGNRLLVAGQIGMDAKSGEMVKGGIDAETTQALKNIQAIVESADFRLSDAVQAQVFLADLNDYGRMNKIYASYFHTSPPARAAVEVARLPRDALVEILLTLERAR